MMDARRLALTGRGLRREAGGGTLVDWAVLVSGEEGTAPVVRHPLRPRINLL